MRPIFLFIICICICICFVGCRTQKATLTQDILTTENVKTETASNTKETTVIDDVQEHVEEKITVEYSAPDTVTGRQYVRRVIMSNIKDVNHESTNIQKQESIIEQVVSELKNNESTKITEQTKIRIPAWMYVAGAIVIAVILILIYIIIKKITNQ